MKERRQTGRPSVSHVVIQACSGWPGSATQESEEHCLRSPQPPFVSGSSTECDPSCPDAPECCKALGLARSRTGCSRHNTASEACVPGPRLQSGKSPQPFLLAQTLHEVVFMCIMDTTPTLKQLGSSQPLCWSSGCLTCEIGFVDCVPS